MYQKVPTNMKFCGKRKKTSRNSGKTNEIFKKEHGITEKKVRPTLSMTARPQPMESPNHRPCSDTCYQRYDPQIPHHERLYGAEKSRVGYPRPSGGAGSGKKCWDWTERSRLRSMAWSRSSNHCKRVCLENTKECGRISQVP